MSSQNVTNQTDDGIWFWSSHSALTLSPPYATTVAREKKCSPSLDAAFKRRRLSWDFTILFDISLMSICLHILLIYSIICFLKASIILNMKVVPNDNFKFGGEGVKLIQVFPQNE